MKTALTLVAVALVSCSGPSVTETPEPTTADASEAPVADVYTDAEQAAILTESIELMYGSDPQPEWYPAFIGVNVRDGVAEVTTSLRESDADLAEPMCRDIAIVTRDDDAQPIGVSQVDITFGRIHDVVECAVPETLAASPIPLPRR